MFDNMLQPKIKKRTTPECMQKGVTIFYFCQVDFLFLLFNITEIILHVHCK